MMVIRAENVFRLEAPARTLLRRTHAESACVALGGGTLLTATRGATNRRLRSNMEQLTLSRRRALGFIASGLGTIVAASCGVPAPTTPATSVAGSSPSKPAPAAASATLQPKTGGTLRYGSDVDVNRLDPHFRLGDVYYTVYDRLTQYDINHNVQPMLAESWDVSSDFTTIKFNLRKGVQFHNGTELDATAIKFNSERARDLPNTQLDEAKWWTSIETPDKYTVIFKSDKPRPLAFDYFEFLNIAEPTSASDPTKAVGTGPSKFVEWKQKDSLTLTKNSNYWQSGKPYLDGIVMSVITDPQAMVSRFDGGSDVEGGGGHRPSNRRRDHAEQQCGANGLRADTAERLRQAGRHTYPQTTGSGVLLGRGEQLEVSGILVGRRFVRATGPRDGFHEESRTERDRQQLGVQCTGECRRGGARGARNNGAR